MANKHARDFSPYTLGILNRFARTETDHSPSSLFHEIRPARVGFKLECVVLAVDFDDELPDNAGEVREVRPNGMLATKLQATHAIGSSAGVKGPGEWM